MYNLNKGFKMKYEYGKTLNRGKKGIVRTFKRATDGLYSYYAYANGINVEGGKFDNEKQAFKAGLIAFMKRYK